MNIRIWRFVTLVLAALSLTMVSAHVLELPQKMSYDAQMYSAVNTTLYRYFAIVGAIYTLGSICAAFVLAYLVRGQRKTFWWTLSGALCLLLAFGTWLTFVAPVNEMIAAALKAAPETVPAMWMQLRARWEYGHAIGFVITLAGFCLLVISILADADHLPITHGRSPAGRKISGDNGTGRGCGNQDRQTILHIRQLIEPERNNCVIDDGKHRIA